MPAGPGQLANRTGALVLCALCGLTAAGHALDPLQALEAVDRFMAAWNSRSPRAFAETLNYPHVRPRADGGGTVFPSAESYAAGIDFETVVSTGWDRSRFDSTRIVHLNDSKAHVAGRYTRWRADGTPIYTTQITYVVTETASGIGVQARFAVGIDDLDADTRERNRNAVVATIEESLAAFNARDESRWTSTFHFPHVHLAGDTVASWESAADFEEDFDFDRFAESVDWQRTEWSSLDVVQLSSTAANVALTAIRYDSLGQPIQSLDGLYLVTFENGRWGIRARSSFAP